MISIGMIIGKCYKCCNNDTNNNLENKKNEIILRFRISMI